MGWETRERGGRYYVRKEWQEGRCVSTYVGTGDLAELRSLLDQSERNERDIERADLVLLRRQQQRQETLGRTAYALIEHVLNNALTAGGYHRQQRHQWRKKRMDTQASVSEALVLEEPAVAPGYPGRRAPSEGLNLDRKLVEKALNGDKAAFGQLCQQHPADTLETFFLGCFDLLFDLSEGYIDSKNLISQEALRCKLRVMQRELGSDTAPPLEKMLIERIAVCWLDLTLRENSYRKAMRTDGGLSKAGVMVREKMVDQAHKRHLAAIKALAEVRKLKLPDVTLQAIGQQVNISRNP